MDLKFVFIFSCNMPEWSQCVPYITSFNIEDMDIGICDQCRPKSDDVVIESIRANKLSIACTTCCMNSSIIRWDDPCNKICNNCFTDEANCSYISIRGMTGRGNLRNEYWKVSQDECLIEMHMPTQVNTEQIIPCEEFNVVDFVTYFVRCIKGTIVPATSTSQSTAIPVTQSSPPPTTDGTGETEDVPKSTSPTTSYSNETIPGFTPTVTGITTRRNEDADTASISTSSTQDQLSMTVTRQMSNGSTETHALVQSGGLPGAVVAIIVVLAIGLVVAVGIIVVLLTRRNRTHADVQRQESINSKSNSGKRKSGRGPFDIGIMKMIPGCRSNPCMRNDCNQPQSSNDALSGVPNQAFSHTSQGEDDVSAYARISECLPNSSQTPEAISSEYASIDKYKYPPNRKSGIERDETSSLGAQMKEQQGGASAEIGDEYSVLYRDNTKRHDYQVLSECESDTPKDDYTYAKVNKMPKENHTAKEAEHINDTDPAHTYFTLDKHDIEVQNGTPGKHTSVSDQKCNDDNQVGTYFILEKEKSDMNLDKTTSNDSNVTCGGDVDARVPEYVVLEETAVRSGIIESKHHLPDNDNDYQPDQLP